MLCVQMLASQPWRMESHSDHVEGAWLAHLSSPRVPAAESPPPDRFRLADDMWQQSNS